MARKAEVGLDYFPLNTDIVNSSKIKLLVAELGPNVWAGLIHLWSKIYREKGYWIDWSDKDMVLLFAEETKLEIGFIEQLVQRCIERKIFDQEVFKKYGVLTSDRIQEVFLEVKKRLKSIELIKQYMVIPESVYINRENVTLTTLNVTENEDNVSSGTQSKVKKRKEKESKGEIGEQTPMHSPDEIKYFKNFQLWIEMNAPNVGLMKHPFTIEEYLRLRADYDLEIIKEILLAMHNHKKLTSKYISANLTARNWIKLRNSNVIQNETKQGSFGEKFKHVVGQGATT